MKREPTQDRPSQKKTVLQVCGLLLLAGALIFGAIRLGTLSPGTDKPYPLYITEILASNVSYPNSEGRCADYIEICSKADIPLDISGFRLGDIAGARLYVFPEGTVLQPGEYRVIYCSNTATADYAPFEINRSGGETFYLIANNGAIVDSVTTLAAEIDQAMILLDNGQWTLSGTISPGRNNDTTVVPDRDIYNAAISPVQITELSSASTVYLREYDVLCDWIELYNTSAEAVDLSGFTITDNVNNNKHVFPAGTVIEGHQYLLIPCTDRISDPAVAHFAFSRQAEETVALLDAAGLIIQTVNTIPMEQGSMIPDADGSWTTAAQITPGFENSDAGYQAYLQSIGAESGSIRIREVMASDHLLMTDGFGEFSDWIELQNTTDRAIDLSGWFLSDDSYDLQKWMLPELVIRPDERILIFCSGRNTTIFDEIHADFSLSAGGETLTLSTFAGTVVDTVSFPEAEAHCSFTFDDAGEATLTELPTPGYPNDEAGYEALRAEARPAGPLAIWEVMTANDTYLPQALGVCYDWVELRNISENPLDLTGWSISDDPGAPGMHMLSARTLQPGETAIVILSPEPDITMPGYEQALFSLDAREDQLILFDADGNIADFVRLKEIPLDCSYGRSDETGGFYYITEPSPLNPNNAGYRLISAEPESSYVPGVYSQEDPFTVTLTSPGTIYYTTDGSEPTTESAVYESSLQFESNTVLRAISIEENKLPSDIYTATFIVGDVHELPVVSLVTDPSYLWGYGGVYRFGDMSVKEVQMPSNVAYSGEDGVFSKDCSMNLHGMTTVTAFSKKTFAVRFKDCYDGPLHYDVFEDGEVTTFSSLLIRTSHEDAVSSQMHDVMISHVASECSDTVLSQKYKYVALYLNGEYWGLYTIRERHSEEHFASYMGHPAEGVTIVRTMVQEDNSLKELFELCRYSNLLSEENFAFAESVMDLDSYMDWLIFESYMANIDIYENLRFYHSEADGLWRMGLSDLDLGIVGTYEAFEMQRFAFHHEWLISDLLANETFQERLAYRLAELLAGPLSDENMIALINELADTIRPETVWEEARWGTPVESWENSVRIMINFCDGRARQMVDSYCLVTGCTPEEREAYFGHLELN